MTKIGFTSSESLTPIALEVIREAREAVFSEPVEFVPGTDLGFGCEARVRTISPSQMKAYPFAANYVIAAFHRLNNTFTFDTQGRKILFLDTETWGVEHRWNLPKEQFFRLGQYAWGMDGEIVLTDDYNEVIDVVREADLVIAQNGHPFDLSTLFGVDSIEPLQMAMENKILDTMVLANLVFPAPYSYTDRKGHTWFQANKPGKALGWLSLDNLCFQLGLDGKIGDLKALAKKYGDYHLIPTDDPQFVEYARGDIVALRQLTQALLSVHKMTPYDWREQLNAAIDAQNSRNGIRVDVEAATARRDALSARKDVILAGLQENYGLPTEGKQPWRSNPGKTAIFKALADYGITPETHPEWPATKTGFTLGGAVLKELTAETNAQELGEALAELMGQRSLAQLALDSVQNDGKAHPEITSLQRSGRKSTTEPGLTVWTSRGAGAIEKSYFIPDTEDELLIAFDYSQADARIVAALSGDVAFKERFAEGVDAHELTGRLVFGDEEYDTDPVRYRFTAKTLGHAYAYRAGAKKLAASAKQSLEDAEKFVSAMKRAYRDVTFWQDKVTDEGAGGHVTNDWGRKMVVDPDRAYTQAPALYGQSGTRELMVDSLIRMLYHDVRLIQWLKIQVHDELIFSIPKKELNWAVPKISELMEVEWEPSDGTGQLILFKASHGEPAVNWQLATHD